MNWKNLTILSAVAYLWLWGTDILIHCIMLHDLYLNSAKLWRDMADMHNYMWVINLSRFVMGAFFCWIVSRFHSDGSMRGISMLSMSIGIFLGISMLSTIAYMPISWSLALAWFGLTTIQWYALGIVIFFTKKSLK